METRKLLTFRWIITTLLVVLAVGVMARLGLWQLDRLAQRRAANARIEAQVNAPALDLNQPAPATAITAMEFRQVRARGTYDPANQILLRNQVYQNQPGYHLLTPLRISGTQQAVLVNRGFIPLEGAKALGQFAQAGEVTITGVLKRPFVPRYFGVPDPTLAPGQARLDTWNYVDMARIQAQTDYELLPMLVEMEPAEQTAQVTYPVASFEPLDLSEGPHMGYAIQWFLFAATLALGYPFFVRKQLGRKPQRTGAQAIQVEGVRHETSENR